MGTGYDDCGGCRHQPRLVCGAKAVLGYHADLDGIHSNELWAGETLPSPLRGHLPDELHRESSLASKRSSLLTIMTDSDSYSKSTICATSCRRPSSNYRCCFSTSESSVEALLSGCSP